MASAVIHRRGGVGAGDPNHPALAAGSDPTATYNPFPPQSTYTGPKVGGTKEGFVLTILGSLLGLSLVLLIAWLLIKRRQRSGTGRKSKQLGGSTEPSSFFSFKSRNKGWREMSDDENDEDEHRIYGQDAFEMNPELNGSVLSLPFGPPSPPGRDLDSPRDSPQSRSSYRTPVSPSHYLNSPSRTGYDAIVKHRSPSPGLDQQAG